MMAAADGVSSKGHVHDSSGTTHGLKGVIVLHTISVRNKLDVEIRDQEGGTYYLKMESDLDVLRVLDCHESGVL
jgi:hypothetical protein